MVQSKKEKRLLSSNEALDYGALEAGLFFSSAYPGTPSSEILETISCFSDVDSQWAVNEKVAFEVALSAAIGGVRSLYVSKHVGLNVAADPLMTSAYVGVNAGFVVESSKKAIWCVEVEDIGSIKEIVKKEGFDILEDRELYEL